ncbi:MAG: DUF3592 domain-containing protein [Nanoarchaeota archaeon]|nr:DUF3592 domain-containing protein [Nanoarchaeota archaeon]
MEIKRNYWLFGIILLIVGIYVFYFFGLAPLLKNYSAINWPTTDAKIVSVNISSRQGSGTYICYSPNIQIEYNIGELNYKSRYNQYFGEPCYNNLYEVNQFIEKNPVGKIVNVHYNPKNPYENTTETGLHKLLFFPLLFGLILFIFGVYIMYRVILNKRK